MNGNTKLRTNKSLSSKSFRQVQFNTNKESQKASQSSKDKQVRLLRIKIQQVKGKKITVLKTKPKKNYTRTRGHRTLYTRVQIDS